MANATAQPRARTKRASIVVPDLPASPAELYALLDDIKLQEREPLKQVFILNALAGTNLIIKGPPGTAKSLIAREFCKRIGVADERMRHFEKTLHPQMPADAIMGAYDIEKLMSESRLERKIEGYAPDAESLFLDELTRANGPVTDALLPLLNSTERLFEANGSMKRAPTLFVVAAVNFMPDPSDPQLGAFVSRMTLISSVDYLKTDEAFYAMLFHDEAMRRGEPSAEPQVRISLASFKAAQAAVDRVSVRRDQEFPVAMRKLDRSLKAEGINIDDRQWNLLAHVCRAAAYLAGRDFCVPEDLAATESGIARDDVQLPIVLKLLRPYRSTFDQAAATHREEVATAIAIHERLRAEVENTPPTAQLKPETHRELADAGRTMRAGYQRASKKLEEAERQKRDAPALRQLVQELAGWREWRETNSLPAKWET